MFGLFKFLRRRLLQAIPIILGIAIFNFMVLHMAPGDAADVLAGEAGAATPEYMAQLRARFGLDQPLYVQLYRYIANLLTLDLGFSFRHNMPVLDLILGRLPATLMLMGATLTIAFSMGVLLGVICARNVNKFQDALISVLALLAYAMPIFWIGLMMIVLFAVKLGWLPSSGMESIGKGYKGSDRVVDILRHMVMPVMALSLFFMALYTRLMRASMLEMLGMDFVTTARAKGVSERVIAFKHVLRNALLPMVTLLGLQVGTLLGGSVLVETVFSWPGLGRLAFESVFSRDFNLLLGILFLCSVIVVTVNIVVDVVYSLLDPRIELR